MTMQSKSLEQLDSIKLRKIHLFRELSEQELDDLKSICRLRSYSKSETIFFDSEPYRGFYCVYKGKIRIYKIANDGREHTLHFVSEQNTFAEVPMFENFGEDNTEELTYPANAVSLEDRTQLIFVPKKAFFQIFSGNVNIYLKMIVSLSKRLRLLNKHIESLTLQDVSKRIANFLLYEVKQSEDMNKNSDVKTLKTNVSRADIASYLGIAMETLSRMLGKFQDDGIIAVKGKTITVHDLSGLKKLAQK